MGHRFLIVGAGKQGTAAAYDLAQHAAAERITLADLDGARAEAAADRIDRLVGRKVCDAFAVDLSRPAERERLRDRMAEYDATLGAAGIPFNLALTDLAIAAGTHFADLGGATEVVHEQMERDDAARAAGVTIVPDCGLAPGMVNQLAAYLIEEHPAITSIRLYCGGLPVHPRPPLYYTLVFAIHGLTVEYRGHAHYLRDGEIVRVPALTELERVDVPGVGELEACVTSGGTSTAPWSFRGRLQEYQYKTLRWPGHFAIIRAFADLGFLDPEPVRVGEAEVAPLDLFHTLVPPKITDPLAPTFVIVLVEAEGPGFAQRWWLRVEDDPETGFRAMERATGYPAAIVLAALAAGEALATGVVPPERVMSGREFVRRLAQRGFTLQCEAAPAESLAIAPDRREPSAAPVAR